MAVLKIWCVILGIATVALLFDVHVCEGTTIPTRDCSRLTDHVSNYYKVCSGQLYNQYRDFGRGTRVSGDTFITAFDGYCSHQCQLFDCLRDRYDVDSCKQEWQDDFYKGVNAAESLCDGMRLRPAIREMLGELNYDTSVATWRPCATRAFPSINRCSQELRDTMSLHLGVENFWHHLSEQDFKDTSDHMTTYMYSLTRCVFESSLEAGCERNWAKLVAVVSLDALNSPLNFGVNTTDLLLSIGTE